VKPVKVPRVPKIKVKKPPGIMGRPKGSGDKHLRSIPPPSVSQLLEFLLQYEKYCLRLKRDKKKLPSQEKPVPNVSIAGPDGPGDIVGEDEGVLREGRSEGGGEHGGGQSEAVVL
jgi:hypothetical protein